MDLNPPSFSRFVHEGLEIAFFDEGEYWQEVANALRERSGIEMLAVVEEGGFLAFTNNKTPIASPADFEGLRFRAMDPSQVALYESFGFVREGYRHDHYRRGEGYVDAILMAYRVQ